MKKLYFFLVGLFLFFVCDSVDASNRVNSINMDIYIDSNGTAHVTETWDAYLDTGTEGYKPYYNLENSVIQNFKVYDNGRLYTNIGNWNTSASFSEKSYKNGLHYISDGVELCFGISSYGSHTYRMEYEITNFVTGLADADMAYWTLMPHDFSVEPDNVYIKIYADQAFSDTLDVWGYGNYGGYAYVYDGYIEMSSDGSLSSDEYMTILVKFPKGTFNTINNTSSENFEYYHNMAEEGAEHYEESNKTSFLSILLIIITFIITAIGNLFPFLFFFIFIFGIAKGSNGLGVYNWKFNKEEKKLPKTVPLYRDIPFNKDIYKVYFLANLYGISKNKTDLLGAVLLKWLKEGKIEVIKVNSKFLNREETAIRFKEGFISNYNFEMSLYNMMYVASSDGVLESNELDKWCKKNYSKLLSWFNDVVRYQTDMFVNNGQIEIVKEGTFKIEKHLIKSSLYEDAKIVKGLKDFLLEFSRIGDREAIEVINWQEYLIIAQILGIADKVAKQFKNLYPEIITDYSYDDILFVRNVSVRGVNVARSAKSAAEARSSSYSSGGGGRSSGGGGGGSRGGGGGGGGFR